jgi:hypothetical protein
LNRDDQYFGITPNNQDITNYLNNIDLQPFFLIYHTMEFTNFDF